MEYDDILDELEVYSLVALAAYYAKNWGACSKAIIRLEALEAKPPDEDDTIITANQTTEATGVDNVINPQVDSQPREGICGTEGLWLRMGMGMRIG